MASLREKSPYPSGLAASEGYGDRKLTACVTSLEGPQVHLVPGPIGVAHGRDAQTEQVALFGVRNVELLIPHRSCLDLYRARRNFQQHNPHRAVVTIKVLVAHAQARHDDR